jgi:hypothetical protein
MRGRTLKIRTLSVPCVRPESLHWLQSTDSVRRGHFADCPFELSVQTGGGHSPPLGAVRPSVRRLNQEITSWSLVLDHHVYESARGAA